MERLWRLRLLKLVPYIDQLIIGEEIMENGD